MDIQFIQATVDGLLMAGVYVLSAVGLTLIFGVMNITNFAHGALMTLGMYVVYQAAASLGISPYLAIPIAMVVLFVIGYAIQLGLLDRIRLAPAHNQLLLTLGISMIIENLILVIWSPNYKSLAMDGFQQALQLGALTINKPKLIAFGIAVLITALIYLLLYKTDIGKAIRATASNQAGASLMGIDIRKIGAIAFGIGALCAGVAGGLLTPVLSIYPTIGETFQLKCFVIAVLGGMGNLWGALVAGIIVGVAESITSFYFGGTWSNMVIYGVFILVLLIKPTGLFGRRSAHA